MKNEIAILLSTYNGEKYLSSQIESIRKQSINNWKLYIRDDGSSDSTTNIIKKYINLDKRIFFLNQDKTSNEGVVNSFFELLIKVNARYYMFCDQDDVWDRKKIEKSLNRMKQLEGISAIPTCVFSSLEVVDNNLNHKNYSPLRVWTDTVSLLFANCVTGCTIIINRELKDNLFLNKLDISKVWMHDWWIALVASVVGKLDYLDSPTIKYRQHGGNVVGNRPGSYIGKMIFWRKESKKIKDSLLMVNEFRRMYSKFLLGRSLKYTNNYGQLIYISSFFNNLILILRYPPIFHGLKIKMVYIYILLFHSKSLRLK